MDQIMDFDSRCDSLADYDSDTILGVDLCADKEIGRGRKQLQNSVQRALKASVSWDITYLV